MNAGFMQWLLVAEVQFGFGKTMDIARLRGASMVVTPETTTPELLFNRASGNPQSINILNRPEQPTRAIRNF